MTLSALTWLFALGVAVHNTEEALLLPAWSASAGRWHATVGAREFRLAVVVLTLVLFVSASAATVSGAGSIAAYFFSGYVFAMVANVLMPHLLASLVLRRYMPGTGTALLLNLPLGSWFLYRAITEQYVKLSTFAWVAPVTALTIVGSIPVLFAAGRKLGKSSPKSAMRAP